MSITLDIKMSILYPRHNNIMKEAILTTLYHFFVIQ
jgi:hypothetical protein